jgi:cell division septum initiation protein DivIVA
LVEISEYIKQVNVKLQLLLKQHIALQTENAQLKKTVAHFTAQDISQKETIAAMQQEQLILRASLDKMDETEKKALEKKINGYIKSIDKCIALLSHKHAQ